MYPVRYDTKELNECFAATSAAAIEHRKPRCGHQVPLDPPAGSRIELDRGAKERRLSDSAATAPDRRPELRPLRESLVS
jgi:hypothetical protein